ncbi:hypothetical protein FB567DRAFT_99337 [Paraphoma chrysanthemicola]|uniref:Uncharacterized protein n=1 Tax=Paraphoma chrysanthemicola TaxID=798071 RepID=A0A8K0VWT6_9PLEO|nr:hypothetical protein FB567DRAFT_99337 [Paraphoma chrysanthemicola]
MTHHRMRLPWLAAAFFYFTNPMRPGTGFWSILTSLCGDETCFAADCFSLHQLWKRRICSKDHGRCTLDARAANGAGPGLEEAGCTVVVSVVGVLRVFEPTRASRVARDEMPSFCYQELTIVARHAESRVCHDATHAPESPNGKAQMDPSF